MLASSASHERPSTSAPPRTDATIAPSARGGAGVERAAADVSAAAHRSGRKSARQPSTAERRAVAAARKATFTKAREYIAQLMQQPAMRAIRERGTVGSNEWAVDGSVTDTGHPILANDPHLGLGSPATFYELHINTKDRGGNLNVTGIGFAGAPGVVQGHNEHIAWGSTTNPTDVTDWYLEDVSSDGAGNLFSHYLGNPEPITQLPLQVKVNIENGNVTGFERTVTWVKAHERETRATVIAVLAVGLLAFAVTTFQGRRKASAEKAFAEPVRITTDVARSSSNSRGTSRSSRIAWRLSALMLSPRSKRTTAMRPCGPRPFSTLTNRRSMRAVPRLFSAS